MDTDSRRVAKRCAGVEATTPQVEMREGGMKGRGICGVCYPGPCHLKSNTVKIVKLFEMILAQGFGLGVIGL